MQIKVNSNNTQMSSYYGFNKQHFFSTFSSKHINIRIYYKEFFQNTFLLLYKNTYPSYSPLFCYTNYQQSHHNPYSYYIKIYAKKTNK